MLQDAHTQKLSLPLTLTAGTQTVVAANPNAWIYVHEVIGDLSAGGTVEILSGVVSLAYFTLDAGQGLTVSDEPGEDNRPRFQCPPGQAFVMIITGGTFHGSIHYSLRY
jgi:hypothetical protein